MKGMIAMKKTIALLLAVMLLLSACCDFGWVYAADNNSSTGGTAVTLGQSTDAEIPVEASPLLETVRQSLVMDAPSVQVVNHSGSSSAATTNQGVLLLQNSSPFVDVNETHYFYESVLWAVEKGITSGISATEFGPALTCSRAQVVTFLWRYAGSPAPKSARNPFKDVEVGRWYSNAVLWAVEQGITAGISATEFAPNQPCNRAQVVTFLWRLMQQPEPTRADKIFTDVESGSWYEKPVLWAQERGITAGTSANTFSPSGVCQRAQVVTFLYRTDAPPPAETEPAVGELTIETAVDTVVYIGETLQIKYTYTGDKSALTFKSDDTSILTVNNSGKVTGVSAGQTRVKVYHGSTMLGRIRLVVDEKPVETQPTKPKAEKVIADSFTGPYFEGTSGVVGNYMTFKSTAKTSGDNQAVTATSSDSGVVSVERTNVSGSNRCTFKVKFKGAGTATITITSEDGNASKSYTITVKGSYSAARSGQLSPEEFVSCVNGIMKENGAKISTSMGYRVLTLSEGDLTGSNARGYAEGWVREFWPNGIRSMGLAYQGVNEDGNHVFYIHC